VPKPTVRDKLFMQDIVEMGFILPEKYPRDSTFHHFNGYSVSQIDYILPFKHCDFITDIKIHHRESLNTSTHDPVSGRFIIKPYINACQNEELLYKSSLWLPLFVGIYAEMIQIDISSQSILIAQILSHPSLSFVTKGSKDFLHRIPLPPNPLVLIFGDIGSISSQHFKKQV
jgi:hypothetical protein